MSLAPMNRNVLLDQMLEEDPNQPPQPFQVPGLQAPPPEAQAAAPKTYSPLSGFELDRMNNLADDSGKYELARWYEDHGYGPGGSKQWGAEGVREFLLDPEGGLGKWETNDTTGMDKDPWLRQKQEYLDTKSGPHKVTRYQDVIRDAGGENGLGFSNAETLPGDEPPMDSATMPQGMSMGPGIGMAGGDSPIFGSDFFQQLMARAQQQAGPAATNRNALVQLLG